MILGHGGHTQHLAKRLGCLVEEIVDMSSNLNPLGPPERIHRLIREKVDVIHALPEPDGASMAQGFARYHGIEPEHVIPGNGTTFFIYTLPQAFSAEKALIVGPTYSDYQDSCAMHGVEVEHCLAVPESGFMLDMDDLSRRAAAVGLVFICNPNNPTGVLIPKSDLRQLISAHPDTCFIVDESYLPFVANAERLSLVSDTHIQNVVVLSSMSKIFSIPGLRTGFLSGSAPLIETVRRYCQPWSVNALAQIVIKEMFDHPCDILTFYNKTRQYIQKEKTIFINALNSVAGITMFDTSTYFVLAALEKIQASEFCRRVGDDKILIRNCSNFKGLSDRFVRFSLKDREMNNALVKSIKRALNYA
ncbi:MAG: histidinol phosphate aminotransferase [Desulfobacterales bacterium]|nr:MAG: histidinol phosphate aminotransferase [Desulfobacterales bacterium]